MNMQILLPIFGYLCGSLPFSIWVTRYVKGVDVRDAGSRHATTTNTIRQAGWVPGIAVFLLDTAKGFLPTFLAIQLGLPDWSDLRKIWNEGRVTGGACGCSQSRHR